MTLGGVLAVAVIIAACVLLLPPPQVPPQVPPPPRTTTTMTWTRQANRTTISSRIIRVCEMNGPVNSHAVPQLLAPTRVRIFQIMRMTMKPMVKERSRILTGSNHNNHDDTVIADQCDATAGQGDLHRRRCANGSCRCLGLPRWSVPRCH